ncbi:uncharacterized protein LOC142609006 [Castanea sativa]|uniref:uncharacterized protein LOC142609006 n=1 Tax=Castanea sativa TaxID=21020 RepID=UPI003F64FE02
MLKVNFDGATFRDIGRVGIGVVIRDSAGQAIASLSEQVHLPHSFDIVKALAIARAISFALELGFSSFILEGDSEAVIKSLTTEDVSPFGHILALAKGNTNSSSGISFSYIHKLGNSIAHNLTKHARHTNTNKVQEAVGMKFEESRAAAEEELKESDEVISLVKIRLGTQIIIIF